MKREDISTYKQSFSEEIMNEIVKLYDSGEKVTDIIKKYNLKISPNQITYFLPKMETENICPYCKIPMVRRRSRERLYCYSEDIKCEECGHFQTKIFGECKCDNCQKKEAEIREEKLKSIASNYASLIPAEKIEFSSLEFEKQCLLYILYYATEKYDEFEYLSSDLMTTNLIKSLVEYLKKEGIVYVSPDSPIKAFQEKNFPFKYYDDKVNYVINVSFTEVDKKIICNRIFTAEGIPEDDIKKVFRKIVYEDLLDVFEKLLLDRNISFQPTNEQLKKFRDLLDELSYTQISYLCYKVAVHYNDNITTGRFYKSKVPQQVLATVNTFYHNSMNKYGNVYKNNPEYAGKILRHFIQDILKKDMSILNEVI